MAGKRIACQTMAPGTGHRRGRQCYVRMQNTLVIFVMVRKSEITGSDGFWEGRLTMHCLLVGIFIKQQDRTQRRLLPAGLSVLHGVDTVPDLPEHHSE